MATLRGPTLGPSGSEVQGARPEKFIRAFCRKGAETSLFGGGKGGEQAASRSTAAQQQVEGEEDHADEGQQAPLGEADTEQGPADLGAIGAAMQHQAQHFLERQRLE